MKKPPNLFSFMSPLSLDVWIYMATAYFGVSVLLFILARYVTLENNIPIVIKLHIMPFSVKQSCLFSVSL